MKNKFMNSIKRFFKKEKSQIVQEQQLNIFDVIHSIFIEYHNMSVKCINEYERELYKMGDIDKEKLYINKAKSDAIEECIKVLKKYSNIKQLSTRERLEQIAIDLTDIKQLSTRERLEQIAIDLTDIEQGECTEDNLENWNKSLNKWITFFELFFNKND